MMKFEHSRFLARPVLLGALIAVGAFGAQAQMQNPNPPAQQANAAPAGPDRQLPRPDRMERRVQQMQVRIAQRLAAMKVRLNLTPAQQDAWNAFGSAVQPSTQDLQRMISMRAELRRLPTPERIDRLRELRSVRTAAMDQRFDATKAFYAQLTPEQQKTFDEISLRGRGRKGHHGHHGDKQHEHGGDDRGHGWRHGS